VGLWQGATENSTVVMVWTDLQTVNVLERVKAPA
jgi:hypothetical protein